LAGFYWPGLGVLATLLLVIIMGLLTHNFIGSKLYEAWERLLIRVPFVRPIYSGAKGLMQATTTQSASSFKDVAFLEYPRKGVYSIGFITAYATLTVDGVPVPQVAVFMPNTPTPFTGWTIMCPPEELTLLDMTIEDALKFIVSGGAVVPATLKKRGPVVWPVAQESR
jgi:uncharacterized membrane protein